MPFDRQAAHEGSLNRQRERYGEDLCTIVGPTVVDGGAAGDSVTLGDLATNVKCFVRELGKATETVIGGTAYISSHQVEMERDAITGVITPEYKIKVTTRTPNWIFENPVITEESFSPLVAVNASRVKQGYQ